MDTFVKVDSQVNQAKVKRKDLIITSFKGRPQSYIARQTGVNQTKLNKWINGSGSLDPMELHSISKFLGVEFN